MDILGVGEELKEIRCEVEGMRYWNDEVDCSVVNKVMM
jgi:hypothetical protein